MISKKEWHRDWILISWQSRITFPPFFQESWDALASLLHRIDISWWVERKKEKIDFVICCSINSIMERASSYKTSNINFSQAHVSNDIQSWDQRDSSTQKVSYWLNEKVSRPPRLQQYSIRKTQKGIDWVYVMDNGLNGWILCDQWYSVSQERSVRIRIDGMIKNFGE